jgi:hypothetical protein
MEVCLLGMLCVVSGRGLCDGLITRPEKSYRMQCVCYREASAMRRPCPTGGCCSIKRQICNITRHNGCLSLSVIVYLKCQIQKESQILYVGHTTTQLMR